MNSADSTSTSGTEIKRYCKRGTRLAFELGNRGPLEFDQKGKVVGEALEIYHRTGFYTFENVISPEEIKKLREEVDDTIARAPVTPNSKVDVNGNPAVGTNFKYPSFRYAKPLSDPYGGTAVTNGRYEVKMTEPEPASSAPSQTIFFIAGICQLMDSCLRHYGNPKLLRVAEEINGEDFTPFTDSIWVKEAGLGTSVAWHQDGTTLWQHPDWHEDIHGFNFMTQLFDTTAENALWVVPGTHKLGKADIKARVAEAGTDRLTDAIPMVCNAGDVAICNRQVLHGSFANTSSQRRVSIVHGFHLRSAVLNATTSFSGKTEVRYNQERVHRSSQLIALAIDARRQYYLDEEPYSYVPLADQAAEYLFNEASRETLLKDYNQYSLGL